MKDPSPASQPRLLGTLSHKGRGEGKNLLALQNDIHA